jgi:hypothetical protein
MEYKEREQVDNKMIRTAIAHAFQFFNYEFACSISLLKILFKFF